MSKNERVWQYLKAKGSITNLEIQKIFHSTCPHSIIRDLRKKYGYATISDKWVTKMRKEYNGSGKEVKVTIRFKEYFLKKMEGDLQ